ncbi:MAG: hypothetical protein PHI18_01745 [bacterium]|nr:hypothetical protein [bacterium]
MRRSLILVLSLLLVGSLIAHTALGAQRRSFPTWEWHLKAALATTYSDNLLRLSERDQNEFLSDPDVFLIPMESVDDLSGDLILAPSLSWRAPGMLMISGDYQFKATQHALNAFTDYQTHTFGVSVRPRVRGYRWLARFRAYHIPSFYLRVYRDRDFNEYHSARFRNWDYAGSFRYRLLDPLWLGTRVSWGSYYYNAKFTEYDSEYWDIAGTLVYSFPRNIDLSGEYTRRFSENVGQTCGSGTSIFIEDEPVEDSEYGNSDFTEDEFRVAISAIVPWITFRRTSADVSYRLRRRVYTTDSRLEQDPFHRGRLDHRGEITTSLGMNLTSQWEVASYFSYEVRQTGSEWSSVPSVKDFIRREIGVTCSYSIR